MKDSIDTLKERLRMYEGLAEFGLKNKYAIEMLEELIAYAIPTIKARLTDEFPNE